MDADRQPRIALFTVIAQGKRAMGQPPTTVRRRMDRLAKGLMQDLEKAGKPELKQRLRSEGWIKLAEDRQAWRDAINAATGAKTPQGGDPSTAECYVTGQAYGIYFREAPAPNDSAPPTS